MDPGGNAELDVAVGESDSGCLADEVGTGTGWLADEDCIGHSLHPVDEVLGGGKGVTTDQNEEPVRFTVSVEVNECTLQREIEEVIATAIMANVHNKIADMPLCDRRSQTGGGRRDGLA